MTQFKIMHINIQCLRNKCNSFESILLSNVFNVVMVSEHWLKEEERDLFQLNSYILVSSFCRKIHIHGGVCIFARNDLNCTKIECITEFNNERHFEICCIKLTNLNCVVVTLYRSPCGDINIFKNNLDRALHVLCEEFKHSGLLVGGDFNIDFQSGSKTCNEIIDIFSSFGLEKCISEPTRVQKNSSTCIDNIFVNFEISDAEVLDYHLSDHKSQIIKIIDKSKKVTPVYKTIPNKCIENKTKFSKYLSQEAWAELYIESDPDKAVDIFYNIVNYYHETSFPQISVKLNSNHNNNKVYSNPEVVSKKHEIDRLYYIKKLSSNNEELLAELKQKKFEYEQLIMKLKKDRLNKNILDSTNKQKTIWSIINKNTGKNIHKKESDSISPENYNDFFTHIADKVLKQIPTSQSTHMEYLENSAKSRDFSLFLYPVLEIEVQEVLRSLKNSKATDLYNHSVDMYKENILYLSAPLTYLINLIFETGIFPSKLKRAKIIPLLKSGDIEDVSNYRPIALIPILAKIFEKILALRIISYLDSHKILTDRQFGFRKGRNTSLAVLELINFISEGFENRNSTLVLFLDLSKAFDCVSKEILLDKLRFHGFRGVVFNLMSSYLTNRYQCVFHKGKLSNMLPVQHGVPQGSVLGPLLFLIYVNDLPSATPAFTVLFADDTTFAKQLFDTGSNVADSVTNILSKASDWFNANKLCLNTNKTNTLLFSTKKSTSDTVKFLGLTLDCSLTWHSHISDLALKLSKNVYAIRQIKLRVNLEAALMAYHALFHNTMTYGLINWGTSNQIQSIFVIQKRALRALAGVNPLESCKPWFIKFKILTLPSQVIYCNLTYIREHLSEFNKNGETHVYNTRNRNQLQTPHQRLEFTKKNNFGIGLYNSLPDKLKHLPISQFKSKLKRHLLSSAYYNILDFKYESLG